MGLYGTDCKAGHMAVVKMKTRRRGGITRGRVLHERARQGGSPSSRGTEILRAMDKRGGSWSSLRQIVTNMLQMQTSQGPLCSALGP